MLILSYGLFYTGLANLHAGDTVVTFMQSLGLPRVITTATSKTAPFNPQPRASTTNLISSAINYNASPNVEPPGPLPGPPIKPRKGSWHATPAQAQAYAKKLLPQFGWGHPSEWLALKLLWTRESGWRWNAANPSGAYGIPQSLPGSKMAMAGKNWQDNAAVQIIWGLKYIKQVYGSPVKAWAHEQLHGWY